MDKKLSHVRSGNRLFIGELDCIRVKAAKEHTAIYPALVWFLPALGALMIAAYVFYSAIPACHVMAFTHDGDMFIAGSGDAEDSAMDNVVWPQGMVSYDIRCK